MSVRYLDINGKDKIAFRYTTNQYDPILNTEDVEHDEGSSVFLNQKTLPINRVDQDEYPLVIMVHDFPEGSNMKAFDDLYGRYEEKLAEENFPTLRFDFRGCGESDKSEQDFCIETAVEDLKSIIKWAKNNHNHKRIAIIAAGLGCLITAMAYDPDSISEIVFLWPVFKPMETPLNEIDSLENREFMAKHDYVRFKEHKIGLLLANEMRQINIEAHLQKIKSVTQIQQGTADAYTPYEEIATLRDLISGLTDFGVFEEGEHFLPEPKMRRQMIQNSIFFLKKHYKRLPPGKIREIDKTKIIRSNS